jgi:tRNA (adenine57-N1/adenine58-N1)-methyltransferase
MLPESFVLMDPRGRKFLVLADAPLVRVPGLGAIRTDRLSTSLGHRIEIGGKPLLVLSPSARDLRDTIERGPQTLAPKDLAILLYEMDIRAGSHVAEGGSGSGAMTVALARVVGETGMVYSYELKKEALVVARKNTRRAGVERRVQFAEADLRAGISLRELDAVFLDIPDPWAAVPAAWEALRPCGYLASFSPNVEQIKQTTAAIRRKPFIEVRTIELIEREMEVRDIGVRPSFAPLGHTGYLTFARKVLDTF